MLEKTIPFGYNLGEYNGVRKKKGWKKFDHRALKSD
jgi:hypothetical protein